MKALFLLLTIFLAMGLAAQNSTDTAQSRPKKSNGESTVKGCVAREIDGYYLITAQGERIFLAGGENVTPSVNHIAVIEGEEGNRNNTYSGATGQNTRKGMHVDNVQTLPERCNRSTVPEPTRNPNSTYSTNNPG